MDSLSRLRIVLLLVLSLFALEGFAAGVVSPSSVSDYSMNEPPRQVGSTPAGVCAKWIAAAPAYYATQVARSTWDFRFVAVTSTQCTYKYSYFQCTAGGACDPGTNFVETASSIAAGAPYQVCPANSDTTSTSPLTCQCKDGFPPDSTGTRCEPVPCIAKVVGDTTLGPFSSRSSAWASWTNCQGSCVQVYSEPSLIYEGPSGWYSTPKQSQTGASCSGSGGFSLVPGPSSDPAPPADAASAPLSPPPPGTPASGAAPDNPKPNPSPNPCALGTGLMCPATIGGAQVCVACSSAASPVGNGTTAGVPGTTSGGGGGSSSSTPVPTGGSSLSGTECKDGLCTTTTFVRDANGSVVGKNQDVQYVETYCAKNPGDPVCKSGAGNGGKPIGSGTSQSGAASGVAGKGGVGVGGTGDDSGNTFGGSCGSGFVCKGDAIQCAIAQDQITRNCSTLDDAPATAAAVLAAGAGLHPAAHPWNSGSSVALGSGFDQTDLIAGACPADQSIQVSHFQPVVIPFSKMCDPARMLGNILVGLTALTCLGIVFVRGK